VTRIRGSAVNVPEFARFRRQEPCRSLAAAPCGIDKPRSYQRPSSQAGAHVCSQLFVVLALARASRPHNGCVAIFFSSFFSSLVLLDPFDVRAKLRLCLPSYFLSITYNNIRRPVIGSHRSLSHISIRTYRKPQRLLTSTAFVRFESNHHVH
jgi:hypothetical protein